MSKQQNTPRSHDYRTGYGQTAYKRQLAYERLGIDAASVTCIPFFRASPTQIAELKSDGSERFFSAVERKTLTTVKTQ